MADSVKRRFGIFASRGGTGPQVHRPTVTVRPLPRREAVRIDLAPQSAIGRGLRTLYDGLLAQPLPDRIAALLCRLDTPGPVP